MFGEDDFFFGTTPVKKEVKPLLRRTQPQKRIKEEPIEICYEDENEKPKFIEPKKPRFMRDDLESDVKISDYFLKVSEITTNAEFRAEEIFKKAKEKEMMLYLAEETKGNKDHQSEFIKKIPNKVTLYDHYLSLATTLLMGCAMNEKDRERLFSSEATIRRSQFRSVIDNTFVKEKSSKSIKDISSQLSSVFEIKIFTPLDVYKMLEPQSANFGNFFKTVSSQKGKVYSFIKFLFPILAEQKDSIGFKTLSEKYYCYCLPLSFILNTKFHEQTIQVPNNALIFKGNVILKEDEMKGIIVSLSISQLEEVFSHCAKNSNSINETYNSTPRGYKLRTEFVFTKIDSSLQPSFLPLCVRNTHESILENNFKGEETKDKHTYQWANVIAQLGEKERFLNFVSSLPNKVQRTKELEWKLKGAKYVELCPMIARKGGCRFVVEGDPDIVSCIGEVCSSNGIPRVTIGEPVFPAKVMAQVYESFKELNIKDGDLMEVIKKEEFEQKVESALVPDEFLSGLMEVEENEYALVPDDVLSELMESEQSSSIA